MLGSMMTVFVRLLHPCFVFLLYPPQRSCSGVYWFHHVCPSVCRRILSYDNLSCVSQNILKFYQQLTGEERRIAFIFDDFHFCRHEHPPFPEYLNASNNIKYNRITVNNYTIIDLLSLSRCRRGRDRMELQSITTDVVSSNLDQGEVHNIM